MSAAPTPKFPLQAAQVQTTLACIAYAADTLNDAEPSLDELHAAISHQLNGKPCYATGQNWKLVWGPVESKIDDNLIYAAFDKDSGTLAVSIRGTTSQTLSRFEDIPRSQSSFPGASGTAAKVSTQFLNGLKNVLKIKDKWHGKTLAQFYADFGAQVAIKQITVNGHSQGAALVPMMMLALQDGLVGAPKVSQPVQGFAVAPPTSGNAAFADIVNVQCDCWFIINPKDVVPLGYNRMLDVVTDGIPEKLNEIEEYFVRKIIDHLNDWVQPKEWAQPVRQAILQGVTIVAQGFFDQIGDQHNHNAYLHKLGAVQTDVGDPSAFPKSDPPVIKT